MYFLNSRQRTKKSPPRGIGISKNTQLERGFRGVLIKLRQRAENKEFTLSLLRFAFSLLNQPKTFFLIIIRYR